MWRHPRYPHNTSKIGDTNICKNCGRNAADHYKFEEIALKDFDLCWEERVFLMEFIETAPDIPIDPFEMED